MIEFAGADITIRGLGRAEFRVPLVQGTGSIVERHEDCATPELMGWVTGPGLGSSSNLYLYRIDMEEICI